jgi:hypothetical protein
MCAASGASADLGHILPDGLQAGNANKTTLSALRGD